MSLTQESNYYKSIFSFFLKKIIIISMKQNVKFSLDLKYKCNL